ncbi:MAG: PD40 domain-containing protein [Lentisphaeria bacterium]|nr:PD40 domain-containing protein [Lentisphaeria bacterium]
MKKFFLLALLTCGLLPALPGAKGVVRELTVSKTTSQNPSIYLAPIANGGELNGALQRFLNACGWFDCVNTPKAADYTLEGKDEGKTFVLYLKMGGAPAGAWRFNKGSSPRESAKVAVDTIIEKSFRELKVRGFCRSRIAFCAKTSNGVSNIYTCDIDGHGIEQLTSFRALCVEPCWTPRGLSICYSKYGRTGIDVLETTIAKPRRSRLISGSQGINAGAAVSPDGKSMAVIRSPDHQVDLYLIDLASGRRTRLSRDKAVEASPCWSPDGKTVFYVSDESGRPRIIRHNLVDHKRKRLPTIGSDAVTPDCSGDGKVAYATRINGRYTIAVYDPATGENKRVITLPGDWESPGWAADNRQLVCKRTWNGKQELYVIDTWSGKARLLASPGIPVSMPSWSQCAPKTGAK